ncbi:MAG: hypothetical protein N2746_10155 [Deltaproteobacteria bacterium]|nr:hypothetical protein [Deltaproteobacteria bacterium]
MRRRELMKLWCVLFLFFGCSEDKVITGDIKSGSDILSDIGRIDIESGDIVLSADILADTGLCDIECPQNMHCENNQCVCDKNFENCNNDKSDGCEADLRSLKTCGDCNTDCSVPMLGVEEFVCVNGVCEVSKCKEGRANCNGKSNDGCEVYLNDDPKHCSMCNFDCGQNSVCTQGKCGCQIGYANCNLLLDDGCEQNIASDNDNCGACKNRCGPNAYCSNQKCICAEGFGDCNNSNSDGCETRIYEDKYHCGDCKNDCTKLQNIQSVKCDSGSCVIIDCLYGFGNCDGYNSNGCEANFSTDPRHCGDCATDCRDNSVCSNKQCACQQDYANCNNNWIDGCEVNFNSDKTCGSNCQNYINCGPNAKCTSKKCQCIPPFANCNNLWDDGCEIDISNDRLNCGGCKSTCIKGNYYSGSCINSKCAGGYVFSFSYGSTGNDRGVLLATDPNGNIIMAGEFSGYINLNGKALISNGQSDIFVIKFASNGTILNARSFGSTGYDSVKGLTVNQNGDIIITGYFENEINFGGGVLSSLGGRDIFLTKLNSNLDLIWAKAYGSMGLDEGNTLAIDKELNIILAGKFQNSMVMDGSTLVSKGEDDIFLAKFNNNGRLLWTKAFGAPAATNGIDMVSSLVTDKDNNIYMTGAFTDMENFGGSDLISKGHYDIFLASFNESGVHKKSISIGSKGLDLSTAIRMNSENELLVSAIFSDTLKIGTKEFTTKGGMEILILKLDKSFSFIDGVSFGSSQDDMPVIALDNNDNILMIGSSYGLIKFGEEELTNRGDSDIILVKLTKDLRHVFSYTFGSPKSDNGVGITADEFGSIYITGEISGAVDFGGGDLPYPQLNLKDFFLAKYLP